jgi:UDP-N-acetylglucosamine--N-acetylmuramyl-(pentapeptide) pyrophosphoryl-undecaprenol N-acetylglucosamine transferase
VGNPVIDKIKQIGNTKNILCSEGCIKIAVLGGSQGSSSLNNNLPEILTEISEHTSKIDLWHQSGKGHGESTRKNYDKSKFNSIKVQEYIEDIYEVYSWADLIICRSGAMTVSEIIAVGLPAIMVPYPFAVDNHQYLNAVFLKNSNAGFIVKQGRGFMDDMFLQLKYLLKGDVKTAKTRLQEISDKISALREGLQDADKTIASFCMKDK